jgi:hypothetical protein
VVAVNILAMIAADPNVSRAFRDALKPLSDFDPADVSEYQAGWNLWPQPMADERTAAFRDGWCDRDESESAT